ncbi:hypothetical protein [Nonomuraea dietziae]
MPSINQIELHPHFSRMSCACRLHEANGILTEAWWSHAGPG